MGFIRLLLSSISASVSAIYGTLGALIINRWPGICLSPPVPPSNLVLLDNFTRLIPSLYSLLMLKIVPDYMNNLSRNSYWYLADMWKWNGPVQPFRDIPLSVSNHSMLGFGSTGLSKKKGKNEQKRNCLLLHWGISLSRPPSMAWEFWTRSCIYTPQH